MHLSVMFHILCIRYTEKYYHNNIITIGRRKLFAVYTVFNVDDGNRLNSVSPAGGGGREVPAKVIASAGA